MEISLDTGADAGGLSELAVELIADIAPSFTYASFQTAVPVIQTIAIKNPTGQSFEQCTLDLTSNPPFLRAKSWTIDRLLLAIGCP